MRFIVLLFLVFTSTAFAQSVDWKTLGKPLDEDTKAMKDRRVYFNTDKMESNIALDKAVMSRDKVTAWINEHLGQVMTLDGANYDRQIYTNRLLFTPTGYADYIIYLKNTKLADFLKGNQYKVAAFVDGTPNITGEGLEQNGTASVYSWQVTANLVLSYLDYRNQPPAALFKDKDKSKINNRLPIQAKIDLVRIPVQGNGDVVAINHLSFGAVPPPATTESLDPAAGGE